MSSDRLARPVRPEDLADWIPTLAARMRRVAHHPWNWMVPPRNIYGWTETQVNVDSEPDPQSPSGTVEVRRRCDGWVPDDIVQRDHRTAPAMQSRIPTYEPDAMWCAVDDLQPYLLHRYKLVDTQTRVILTYTVDNGPPEAPARHLSIQITVPGRLSQRAVDEYKDTLLSMQEGIVRAFFPAAAVGVGVRAGMRVGTPWEFRDPVLKDAVGIKALSWKTPVVMDFVMDHDLAEPTPTGPRRKVQLYGPDGTPL